MKTLTQVVLPILVVVGLIGGVTFVSQYSGTRPKTTKKGGPNPGETPTGDLLVFPVRDGSWDAPQDEDSKKKPYVAEFEEHQKGHYDFWFWNPTSEPVNIQLTYQSCTCSAVSVGQPDSIGEAFSSPPADIVAQGTAWWVGQYSAGALASPNVLAPIATEIELRRLAAKVGWQELHVKGEPAKVNGSAGRWTGGLGIVRLSWVVKKPEQVLLAIKLVASQEGRTQEVRLTLPVNFVLPVRLDEPLLRVPELSAKGQKETVSFHCWSSTRDHFPLKVVDEKKHPCIVSDIRPLNAEETRKLEKEFETRVRCGYRVTVTVHERVSDAQQLDLGPFLRRLIVTGPDDIEPTSVTLSGSVKGEVTLRPGDSKDRIDLGSFKAVRNGSKTVTLTADEPGLDLKLDSWAPDYLAVTLGAKGKEGGVQRWELTVSVPPGRLTGRLPPDAAVILQTQGTTPRRMRIPVVGEATQ